MTVRSTKTTIYTAEKKVDTNLQVFHKMLAVKKVTLQRLEQQKKRAANLKGDQILTQNHLRAFNKTESELTNSRNATEKNWIDLLALGAEIRQEQQATQNLSNQIAELEEDLVSTGDLTQVWADKIQDLGVSIKDGQEATKTFLAELAAQQAAELAAQQAAVLAAQQEAAALVAQQEAAALVAQQEAAVLAAQQEAAALAAQQEAALAIYLSQGEIDTSYSDRFKNQLNSTNPIYNVIQHLSSRQGDDFWRELRHGVAILMTPQHLSQYVFSYGKMHRAKLTQALSTCINQQHFQTNGQDINIIDYGCGQGLGTIALFDYLKTPTSVDCTFSKIILIEPSTLALKRAFLHVHESLVSRGQNEIEQISTFEKYIDEIEATDLITNQHSVTFHLFSNILDIEAINIQELSRKIKVNLTGKNYFICVSPNFWQNGQNPRNNRLRKFAANFQEKNLISERTTPIGRWTRHEIVFEVD